MGMSEMMDSAIWGKDRRWTSQQRRIPSAERGLQTDHDRESDPENPASRTVG